MLANEKKAEGRRILNPQVRSAFIRVNPRLKGFTICDRRSVFRASTAAKFLHALAGTPEGCRLLLAVLGKSPVDSFQISLRPPNT